MTKLEPLVSVRLPSRSRYRPDGVRIGQVRLVVADPHVQPVAVLDLRRQRRRRPVAHRRRYAVDAAGKQRRPQVKRQREGVLHVGGPRLAGEPGGAGVDRVLAGGDVVDQPQLGAAGRGAVVGDQAARHLHRFLGIDGRVDVGVLAGAVQPLHVVLQPIRLAAEGAQEVGDRRAEDDAEIVNRQLALRRRNEFSVQVGERFAPARAVQVSRCHGRIMPGSAPMRKRVLSVPPTAIRRRARGRRVRCCPAGGTAAAAAPALPAPASRTG